MPDLAQTLFTQVAHNELLGNFANDNAAVGQNVGRLEGILVAAGDSCPRRQWPGPWAGFLRQPPFWLQLM